LVELRAGFAVGQHGPLNEAVLRRFLTERSNSHLVLLRRQSI